MSTAAATICSRAAATLALHVSTAMARHAPVAAEPVALALGSRVPGRQPAGVVTYRCSCQPCSPCLGSCQTAVQLFFLCLHCLQLRFNLAKPSR